jgi:protein TonB
MQKNESYFLDFLFETRNQQYGAYQIRKEYNRNLTKALLIASSSFITIFLILFAWQQLIQNQENTYQIVDYKSDVFSVEDVKIPSIKIESAKTTPLEEKINKEALPNVVEEETTDIENTPKTTIETKSESASNTVTSTFSGSATPVKSVSSDTSGSESFTNEIYMTVDATAEFPGGKGEFDVFVKNNIKLPEYVMVNRVKGIVYVHIVINKDGSVNDIKLYKGIEQTCNDEVLRIIKTSPNWIPARKDGKTVRQRLILPVKIDFE